ncbi:MAG TPA: GAF domain-containing protein, partial [Herpetosiphonaceae bacterium]
ERALDAIHVIARAVLVPREPIALCRTIFQALQPAVPFSAGYIEQYDEAADRMHTIYLVDRGLEEFGSEAWDHRQSPLVAWVLRNRRPLVFDDFDAEVAQRFPTARPQVFGVDDAPTRAWITVPLLLGGAVVGLINIQSAEAGLYGPAEQQLLQVLANPLAVALENSRLIAALERAVEDLEIPIIPLSGELLVVPLVGVLDQPRWESLTERLLAAIGERAAGGVLLDASGITSFDPHTIRAITVMFRAIALLGARSVVIGMRPELIQELVRAGTDLAAIATARDLAGGLALLRRLM